MRTRLFVPKDSAAVAVGADETAARLAELAASAGREVEIIRNGSRGLRKLQVRSWSTNPCGKSL